MQLAMRRAAPGAWLLARRTLCGVWPGPCTTRVRGEHSRRFAVGPVEGEAFALPRYSSLLLSDIGNGVVMLELNRPDRVHALSEEMGGEIVDFCKWVEEANPPARCVVVAGAVTRTGRRAFSAGRDLKLSQEHATESERQFYMSRAVESVLALRRCPVPTIAAVTGPAYGWGAELALACDLRLLEEGCELCFPETRLGLFPGAMGCVMLPRIVGPERAKEMIFTAERLGAAAAARGNLGRRVDDAVAEALALAGRIAANAPLGVRGAKAVLDASIDGDAAAAMELSRRLRGPLTKTKDHLAALEAWRSKSRRPVEFKGH